MNEPCPVCGRSPKEHDLDQAQACLTGLAAAVPILRVRLDDVQWRIDTLRGLVLAMVKPHPATNNLSLKDWATTLHMIATSPLEEVRRHPVGHLVTMIRGQTAQP